MNQASAGYVFVSHVIVPLENSNFLYDNNNAIVVNENPMNGTTSSSEHRTIENKYYNTGNADANTVRAVWLPTDFYNVLYETVQKLLSVTIRNGQYSTHNIDKTNDKNEYSVNV